MYIENLKYIKRKRFSQKLYRKCILNQKNLNSKFFYKSLIKDNNLLNTNVFIERIFKFNINFLKTYFQGKFKKFIKNKYSIFFIDEKQNFKLSINTKSLNIFIIK